MAFKKSSKADAKLRLALIGPAGSGKTYTALAIACALSNKVAVLDTEHGSASKYADVFNFDVQEPESFNPKVYIDAIAEAEKLGYGVLILDSLSHAWMGKDGALELVDKAATRMQSKNTYVAWRDVTPLHNQMVDAIIGSKLHIIATLRSKTEYVLDKDSNGRTVPRKVGIQPVQRDGLEYEFDVVADLDQDNTLIVSKTRCPALTGATIQKPGAKLAAMLSQWLSGEAISKPLPKPAEEKPAQPVVRPWDAEGTRAHVNKFADDLVNAKTVLGNLAAASELQAAMASLSGLVNGSDEKRHSILKYLFGAETGKVLTSAQCKSLQKWIDAKPSADGEWVPGANSILEAEAVLYAEAIRSGQTELPIVTTA